MSAQGSHRKQRTTILRICLIIAGVLGVLLSAQPPHAAGQAQSEKELPNVVWGMVRHYGNTYIIVDDAKYEFHKLVVIDAQPFKKDKRGNVRVTLNREGRAIEVMLHGMDMPELVSKYKR